MLAARLAVGAEKVGNSIAVLGRDQVMLEVTFAEVARSIVKQLGIDLTGSMNYGTAVVKFNNTNPFTASGAPLVGTNAISAAVGSTPSVQATIRAMESSGVLRTLAEPNLTAVSGASGTVKAGRWGERREGGGGSEAGAPACHVPRCNVFGSPQAPSPALYVLVNANTASASEIVSGSLVVHGRAKLIGAVTFGKGSVQQDFAMPDGSDLHITIRHWFLPDGSSVEQKGLIPSVSVKLASPDDMFDASKPDLGHARDTQLNQALDLLAKPAS